jgi:hypothetical protein
MYFHSSINHEPLDFLKIFFLPNFRILFQVKLGQDMGTLVENRPFVQSPWEL